MSRFRTFLLATGCLSALAGCGDAPAPTEPDPTAAATAYLHRVLDIMQENSINRYVIGWPEFRRLTIDSMGTAYTTRDTYPAIRFAIEMLDDNHSFFVEPTSSVPNMSTGGAAGPSPRGNLLRDVFGYTYVPWFSGTRTEGQGLADSLQALIESYDGPGRCGWVVDLRYNLGGNMWPMLAGIGPVLGDGLAGFFVDPDPAVTPREWGYTNGSSWLDGGAASTVNPAYVLVTPNPTVAVLTDEHTASSGEAITIAFRARPNTRSFGEPTWGVSTANRDYPLSDGATLLLTVSTMADRTGTLYGVEVEPDEIVVGDLSSPDDIDPTTGLDPVVEAALDWLEANGDCLPGPYSRRAPYSTVPNLPALFDAASSRRR